MTITINYRQQPTDGYTPRKPVTLHNVAAVVDKGINSVEVRMLFNDNRPTHDHVASVNIKPETE